MPAQVDFELRRRGRDGQGGEGILERCRGQAGDASRGGIQEHGKVEERC